MEQTLKAVLKNLKVNENLISTLMGTLVVAVVGVMFFNYFKGVANNGVVPVNDEANQTENVEGQGEMASTYKVQKGDHLWKIAEEIYGSGYNYVDIVRENNLKNPNNIEVGMELKLPRVEKRELTKMAAKTEAKGEMMAPSKDTSTKTYTTQKGDYLWKIAVSQYGDGYAWVKIYNANKDKIGRNPSVLEKNVTLVLP